MIENNDNAKEEKIKKIIKNILPYVIIIIVVVIIRTFFVTPIQVDGTSMYPTLKDNELLLLKKYDKSYDRFDVIVFNHNGSRLIKRIIGLPGENIEYKDNKLYIDGEYVEEPFLKNGQRTNDFRLQNLGYETIPKGYYFVMGDNRTNSTDSRIIGPVSENYIEGITDFAIFPFNSFGNFNK